MSRETIAILFSKAVAMRSQRLVLPDAVPPHTPMKRGFGFLVRIAPVAKSDLEQVIEKPSLKLAERDDYIN